MRAELVAKIGDCCMGGDPLCTGGCLAEKAAKRNAEREAALAAQGQGVAAAWRIDTDDDVERVAKAAGWDNRRYMTRADYAIWCIRMREFVRLAVYRPASPAGVPDGFIEDIQRAERLALKSKKLSRERMMGLAVMKHFGHVLAAAPSAPEGESHE